MGKAHPFYRFQQTWNNGFFPDNKVVTSQLNAIAGNLDSWVSTYAIGLTLSQVVAHVKQEIEVWNAFPYLGNYQVTVQKISDSPNWEFNINVFDLSLSTIDNNQVVTINGFFNPTTQIVVSASVDTFTPGIYSGTFDATQIAVEDEVANSLSIVNKYGSAMFPLVYSYDTITGIATSGLARAKNWQLDVNGNPTRLPADTQPQQNARLFQLEQLTPEDKYAVAVGEKLINFSIGESDMTLIDDYFNTFTAPDGWTYTLSPSYDTYNRFFCLLSRDDRSFLFIGRYDGAWIWQRFVNESGSTDFSYFGAYVSTEQLPYAPNISTQWIYGEWYDYDFCEFNYGCYVSPEFYAMPAIPGDQWQFNVPMDEANLIGKETAQVGIFKEDGQFIQNIGSAYLASGCFSQMYASVTIPAVATGCYRLGMYQPPVTTCDLQFFYLIDAPTFLATINAASPNYLCFGIYDETSSVLVEGFATYIPVEGLTETDIVNFANTIPGMTAFYNSEANYFTFTWDYNVRCNASYSMKSYIGDVDASIIEDIWTTSAQECVCNDNYYLYSLSNIINIDASDCFSTMLEFWSDNNSMAEGFEYISDWKQKVRIGLNGGGAKPVIEENLYRQSNGVHKRPQNKQDLSVDLHSDFLDEETQLALVDATRHPYLVWNQKPIFVKGDIEVATIQDFTTQSSFETLAQVKFQALIQGFQPKNSSCLTC